MKSRLAIIDLGTNTFHLLVAEPRDAGYWIVHRERLAVKLGMHGINDGIITDSAIDRALAAIEKFKNTIDHWQVKQTFAFGTSALRNAANGITTAQAIGARLQAEVSIIDGPKEAEYIFHGVQAALGLDDVSLVMDIGGGSVEFIIGSRAGIRWKQSCEIGAQRLLEKYHHHDPISPQEIRDVEAHLERELGELFTALRKHNPKTLAGASGSFDTLSEIFCMKNQIPVTIDNSETPLRLDAFFDIYEDLLKKTRDQRMQIPGMIEMRVDMIVVACCLINFILKRHPFTGIRVSSWSLKEGVLAYLDSHGTIR